MSSNSVRRPFPRRVWIPLLYGRLAVVELDCRDDRRSKSPSFPGTARNGRLDIVTYLGKGCAAMDTRYHTAKLMGHLMKVSRFPTDRPPRGGNPDGVRAGDNDKRLSQSLSRTKARVLEIALCNEWGFFFTGTFSPDRFDRYDLVSMYTTLTQGIRDLNRNRSEPIRYCFVPERHDSGAWHIHGFLLGLGEDDLSRFDTSLPLPYYLLNKIRSGHDIFNWPWFASHFGFCDLEPIRDPVASCFYITKYITKDLVSELQTHIYRASIGLNRAYSFGSFLADREAFRLSFDAQYVSVGYFDATLDLQKYVLSFLFGEIGQTVPFEVYVPPFPLISGDQIVLQNFAGWCNGNISGL